jgi:hypothetical protein
LIDLLVQADDSLLVDREEHPNSHRRYLLPYVYLVVAFGASLLAGASLFAGLAVSFLAAGEATAGLASSFLTGATGAWAKADTANTDATIAITFFILYFLSGWIC